MKAKSLYSANTGALLRNIGFLIALSMLVGCSVGPKYRPPVVRVQPFHNAPLAGTEKSAAPPLDTWWEGFQDPELTRIIQRAIDQNLDLAASLTRSIWRLRLPELNKRGRQRRKRAHA